MITLTQIAPPDTASVEDEAAVIKNALFGARRARVAVYGAQVILAGWEGIFLAENDTESADFVRAARRRLSNELAALNDVIVNLAIKGGTIATRNWRQHSERLREETASEEAAASLIALAIDYLRKAVGGDLIGGEEIGPHVTSEILDFSRKETEGADAG